MLRIARSLVSVLFGVLAGGGTLVVLLALIHFTARLALGKPGAHTWLASTDAAPWLIVAWALSCAAAGRWAAGVSLGRKWAERWVEMGFAGACSLLRFGQAMWSVSPERQGAVHGLAAGLAFPPLGMAAARLVLDIEVLVTAERLPELAIGLAAAIWAGRRQGAADPTTEWTLDGDMGRTESALRRSLAKPGAPPPEGVSFERVEALLRAWSGLMEFFSPPFSMLRILLDYRWIDLDEARIHTTRVRGALADLEAAGTALLPVEKALAATEADLARARLRWRGRACVRFLGTASRLADAYPAIMELRGRTAPEEVRLRELGSRPSCPASGSAGTSIVSRSGRTASSPTGWRY